MSSARRSGMGCAFFATPAGCYAEKQWGSIRETHFQAEEILIVKAQRSAFSEPLAVIRITAARSPFGMTTPPRKATTLPELAGTRSPGTTMPTRFIGSAAETGIVSPDGCSWRMARKDSTATGNANCSPKKPLTNRPPLTSPRSSSRLRIISSSRHFGRIDSQARSSRKTIPIWRTASSVPCSPKSCVPGARCCQRSSQFMNCAGVTDWISFRSSPSVSRWMRETNRRSHHSVCPRAGSLNLPLTTTPLDSSCSKAFSVSMQRGKGPSQAGSR